MTIQRTQRKRRGRTAQFGAPWSAGVKGVTWTLVALAIGMLVVLPVVVPHQEIWAAFLGPGIMLIVFSIVGLFCVRGYTVQHGRLWIQRSFWETEIPLHSLKRAYVDPEAFRRPWRKAGNGGLMGYTGWFWSKRVGGFRAYITDPARCVVIELKDRKIVVSPHDPAGFVEAIGEGRGADGGAR